MYRTPIILYFCIHHNLKIHRAKTISTKAQALLFGSAGKHYLVMKQCSTRRVSTLGILPQFGLAGLKSAPDAGERPVATVVTHAAAKVTENSAEVRDKSNEEGVDEEGVDNLMLGDLKESDAEDSNLTPKGTGAEEDDDSGEYEFTGNDEDSSEIPRRAGAIAEVVENQDEHETVDETVPPQDITARKRRRKMIGGTSVLERLAPLAVWP